MTLPTSKKWRLKIRNIEGTPKQWRVPQLWMSVAGAEFQPSTLKSYPYHDGLVFSASSTAADGSVAGFDRGAAGPVPTDRSFHFAPSHANGDQTAFSDFASVSAIPFYNLAGDAPPGDVWPYATTPWISEESTADEYLLYEFPTAVTITTYYLSPQFDEPPPFHNETWEPINQAYYASGYMYTPTDWDFQYWDGVRWVTVDSKRDKSYAINQTVHNPATGLTYFIDPAMPYSSWDGIGWHANTFDSTSGSIAVEQYAVEVLRDNGEPQAMKFEQMALEVLRFNGDEIGTGTIDEFPGANPANSNWFSMF